LIEAEGPLVAVSGHTFRIDLPDLNNRFAPKAVIGFVAAPWKSRSRDFS